MRAGKFVQRFDGEPYIVSIDMIERIACCDCGLTHDFEFEVLRGRRLRITATVNRRSTANVRRFREYSRVPR